MVNPAYDYSEQLGWTLCVYIYDLEGDKLNAWREVFSDVDGALTLDGGRMCMREYIYEGMVEPAPLF